MASDLVKEIAESVVPCSRAKSRNVFIHERWSKRYGGGCMKYRALAEPSEITVRKRGYVVLLESTEIFRILSSLNENPKQ